MQPAMQPIGTFMVDGSHPSLPGHFPNRPIVPGVVLLDEVAALVLAVTPGRLAGFPSVRFSRPVRPGDRVAVAYAAGRFTCTVDAELVVQGRISLE